MSTIPYQEEYRIHPSERDQMPDYIASAIDRHHAALVAHEPSTIEIEISQDPHHYSIRLSGEGIVVSTSLNAETDTVAISRFTFEERGGIGDIILTMIAGGALPKTVDPHELTSTAPSP